MTRRISPPAAQPPSGTPSQRTLSAERPLSATDARKADTSAWFSPRGYAPDLHEALRRAERHQHQRINWTVLAVALVCVFLLGMAAVAVPAMVMAGFGL